MGIVIVEDKTHPDQVMRGGQPVGLPTRLYKFMKAPHAASLLEHGGVRIGTLYDYRNKEKYKDLVVDTGEGTMFHTEIVNSADLTQLSPYSRRMMVGGGPNIHFQNSNFQGNQTAPNVYAYCLSLSNSWEVETDAEYTACGEVFDVSKFLRGLVIFLGRQGLSLNQFNVGEVRYVGRNHTTTTTEGVQSGGPPIGLAYLKPIEYVSQKEYRFTFVPVPLDIAPVEGEIPDIRGCCRLHSFRPEPGRSQTP